MTIGDKIRTLRKENGFNQTELGERLGVKTNAVSKWECGRVEDIPMSKVKMMASLFGVPVSYLIDDDKEEEKEQPTRAGELSEAKQAMYDFIDTLSDEQVRRLLQIAHAALDR
jgi:transcriptional regulator with XRE-family HTH domain